MEKPVVATSFGGCPEVVVDGSGLRVGVVAGQWHTEVTDGLLAGARRALADSGVADADVVEVAPPFDTSGGTALVGATLMYEILCLLAEIVAKR